MNILRLAWSSYQDQESLKKEQRYLEDLGHRYRRIEPNGPIPDKLASYDVLLINSQFQVDESFLNIWEEGLILTASNGFDHIKLDSASALDIDVARTPLARKEAVVDHTYSFVDALLRDHHRSGTRIDQDQWPRAKAYENISDASNVNFGILGYGVIGQQVAKRALKRDFRNILVYDPIKTPESSPHEKMNFPDWEQFIESTDLLTLHADLNPTTRELMDDSSLEKLGPSGYLINTARGSMVNADDLLACLSKGKLAGAALDVFPEEPPTGVLHSDVDGLLTSPHSAGFYPGLLSTLREEIGSTIDAYSTGKQPEYTLTPRTDQEWHRLEIPRDV
jgi:D-3-phosphoglycerate dehydrogenase